MGPYPSTMTSIRRPRAAWLMAPLLALALLAACGGGDDKTDTGSGDSTTETSAPSGPTTTESPTDSGPAVEGDSAVTIKSFKFGPDEVTVGVGTKVTWTNEDSSTHTATGADDSFDTGRLKKGDAGDFTFAEAGTFEYKCDIHPTMKGTVIVE